ncbi:MAG: hypothetical protein OEU26_01385 [Candidatus Tectomicrobia bacterium]|nr:hypothetical protein [Candidatus Tectomicrobia bacterium]
MFKRNEEVSLTVKPDVANASLEDDQLVEALYHQPEVYDLGSLEKVQAYIMNGYPDGWRGYYSRS